MHQSSEYKICPAKFPNKFSCLPTHYHNTPMQFNAIFSGSMNSIFLFKVQT